MEETREKRRAALLKGFRRVPVPILDREDATEILVIGEADASNVIYMQAGFPDNQTAFVALARRLASEADCLVGLGCMPEFDNKSGKMIRWGGYTFDEAALCFGQSVAALRAQSTDASSSLILGMHDWGVIPGLIFTRRAAKSGDRAICPSKVICFDVLPPVKKEGGGLLSMFDGVRPYHLLVHMIYRGAFALVFAVSRLSVILGSVLLVIVNVVIFVIFGRCLNPTGPLDMQKGMGPSIKKPGLVVNCCYPYFHMFKEAIFGGALVSELGLPPLERIPLLFIYGQDKNTHFHTQEALDAIDASEHSMQFGLHGAAHWCYKQKEDECVELVKSFLKLKKESR